MFFYCAILLALGVVFFCDAISLAPFHLGITCNTDVTQNGPLGQQCKLAAVKERFTLTKGLSLKLLSLSLSRWLIYLIDLVVHYLLSCKPAHFEIGNPRSHRFKALLLTLVKEQYTAEQLLYKNAPYDKRPRQISAYLINLHDCRS